MANTAALVTSTPYRVVYLLTGDGTVAGPTLDNALLLSDMVAGPLKDIFNATYSNQAAMRVSCLTSAPCRALVQMRATVNDVTAEKNQVSVDVDVDAITASKPEVNITMSDTTGQVAYLTLEYLHSIVK
jgi:microcystin degradation protein MlrC